MKKIIRTFIFSAIALYITSLWNGGFTVKGNLIIFIKFAIVFTFVFLFIKPILKLVLFPINLLTFGIVGSIMNFLLFYIIFYFFRGLKIFSWTFPGGNFFGFHIPEIYLSSIVNFLIVIVSVSFLTSLFEFLL